MQVLPTIPYYLANDSGLGFFMRPYLILLLNLLLCVASTHARAEQRVALVIGNSAYQKVPNLPNPANDAAAVALLLRSAGFDVVDMRENLGFNDMRRAVRDFSDRTSDAEISVIYYAGHGMEVGGINYLVPVDATLRRDIDVEDETISLDRLLQVMEPAKRLRLVILDACRDNPFVKSMARTMNSRSIGRGLARIEPTTSDTLVAFAAKAGLTAADGEGSHSPYTTALLKYLVQPNVDLRISLGRVRDDVMLATNRKQEPFVYGSLGGSVISLASLSTEDRTPAVAPTYDASVDYELAAKIGTKASWDVFLERHPTGFYADLARKQRVKLDGTRPEKEQADIDAKRSKRKPVTQAARSYPDCRPDYEASYAQSLANARSVGVYPRAMIAQHKRQCGY